MKYLKINDSDSEIQTEMLAKFMNGDFSEWGIKVNCPVCGWDYVHFRDPMIIESDDYTAWSGRGSAIRIPMYCEDGCKWELRIGFHKGNSYLAIENAYKAIHEK